MSDLDDLLRLIITPAHMVAIDAINQSQTMAEVTRRAVREALECAIGNDLITVTPRGEWPHWITTSRPYDAQPDWIIRD